MIASHDDKAPSVSRSGIDGWVYFPISFTSKIKLTTKWNKTSAMLYFSRTYWSSNCTFIWDRGAVDMPSFLQSNKWPPLVASLEEYLRWQQLATCNLVGCIRLEPMALWWYKWYNYRNESQSLERKTFDFTMESVRVVRALVGVAWRKWNHHKLRTSTQFLAHHPTTLTGKESTGAESSLEG